MKTAIIVASFFSLAFLTNRIVMQKCVNTLSGEVTHSSSDVENEQHVRHLKLINRMITVQAAQAWESCSQQRSFANCAIIMSYKLAGSPEAK